MVMTCMPRHWHPAVRYARRFSITRRKLIDQVRLSSMPSMNTENSIAYLSEPHDYQALEQDFLQRTDLAVQCQNCQK